MSSHINKYELSFESQEEENQFPPIFFICLLVHFSFKKWNYSPCLFNGSTVRSDYLNCVFKKKTFLYWSIALPWWLSGKESTCHAGNSGSILGLGRSPGGGHDKPLRYSCLETPMDRGAWQSIVHWVAKSWTWLKPLSTHSWLTMWW